MKKHLITAFLMTIATAILLGVLYPLLITALAQVLFKDKANGQIRYRNGEAIGSRIIGQSFASAKYFHSRPSAAGNGYDATSSGGSNLGPTSKALMDSVGKRIKDVTQSEGVQASQVPIDLVTASGSGLDPDISPAAADLQAERVAKARAVNPH